MNAVTSQLAIHYDERDRQYAARSAERRKAEAERIFNDPISLSLIVSEAMDEEPMRFGAALQAMREGDSFTFAALCTAAVYESVK